MVASAMGRIRSAPSSSAQPLGVGRQLVSLASPGVVGDDPLGQQLLGVDAAGAGGSLALPDLLIVGAEMAVHLTDVADLRPARVGPHDPLRVGHHRHDLLADYRTSIVLPIDLLIFLTPSVPSTVGASV
jgi:hypothetical protein